MRTHTVLILASTAAALAVAAPASAQTGDEPFTGFYGGVSVSYDTMPKDGGERIKFDKNNDGNFNDTVLTTANVNAFSPGFCGGQARGNAPAAGCRKDKESIGYSARAGYDRQYNHIVVGGVVEVGDSQVRDSVSAFSTTPASYTINRKINVTAQARLRAGFAADQTLFYGTGGLAYARVNNYFRTTNTTNVFTSNKDSDAWGYVVGGGVEHRFGRNLSVGAEYTFNSLKDDDYRVRVTGGPATSPFNLGGGGGTTFARSYTRHVYNSFRAVVNYRF